MNRPVTLKDIARKLNLSHATVSRALNRVDDPFISEATRMRVRQAAEDMGYRPNHAARALVTGRTGLVSLWLWAESVHSSYHARVAQAMQAEMERQPYQLIVNMVGYRTLEFAREKTFSPWGVDGIIAHEAAPAVQALLGDANGASLPIVSTGAYYLLEGVDRVGIDFGPGAQEAVRHLVASGRTRIAYLAHGLEHLQHDARYQAYVRVLGETGLPPECIDTTPLRADARDTMGAYVREKGAPGALFCHNDDLAIAAYRALCDLGVRVPDDVAIVGCDGIEDTEYLEVPLSTIVQPLDEMCAIAWRYLESRMRDPAEPLRETWLTPRLVIRESSRV